MQSIRIIEIPKCKMVSSGTGMFGEEKFERFGQWFSSLPRTIYPKDFLFWDGAGLCWLYLYDEHLNVPSEFEIIDFEGGLYSVATDIDQQTDAPEMDKQVDEFLEKSGFERDESRFKLGNIITSPLANEILGYNQMDYYSPIKKNKECKTMSAEIIKVFKEQIPNVRFIGKCYTENDRQNGSFGHKWGEWFANGYFDMLEKLGKVANVDFGYLGFMRCNGNDMENTFEYWIGIFLPENTPVPHGFSYIDLQAGNVGVCYIKGREDDGLYGMHEQCIEKLSQNGMNKLFSDDKNRAYFFERYNCPRFTTPDENGNVILDYCVYLEE